MNQTHEQPTRKKPKQRTGHVWEVIDAPDTFWIGRLFRSYDIQAGGWDNGMTFRNQITGQTITFWNGHLRKDMP